MSLTCGGASAVIHIAVPAVTPLTTHPDISPLGWAISAAVGWILILVFDYMLVVAAIKASNPAVSVPGPLARRELRHGLPELAAGTAIAFALTLGSAAVIVTLPAAVLLQRPLHRSCACHPAPTAKG